MKQYEAICPVNRLCKPEGV